MTYNGYVLKPVITQNKSILGQLKLPVIDLHITPEKKQSEPIIHILENELKKNKNLHSNALW